ncbi:MAG: radical SAM protein, partial [Acidimicrobiia bacterium]
MSPSRSSRSASDNSPGWQLVRRGTIFPMLDTMQRPVRDLRISVTDRCNFRCSYCMPKEIFNREYEFLARDLLLSFEEIARVAGILVERGIEKIRLTGGEPLLRVEIEKLVEMLAGLG